MSSPKLFFKWLKNETLSLPRKQVDQKILEYAHGRVAKEKTFTFNKLLIIPSAIALGLVFFLTTTQLNKINQHPISESPELIAYYDQIELMNQASSLSDEEWDLIIKEKQR
jgi:hypothetical protein